MKLVAFLMFALPVAFGSVIIFAVHGTSMPALIGIAGLLMWQSWVLMFVALLFGWDPWACFKRRFSL